MNIVRFKNGFYNTETDEFTPTLKEKSKSELKIAVQLLPILSRKHLSNKNECINIGSLLFNIDKGSYVSLGEWLEFVFSVKNPIFTELECIKYWGSFKIRKEDCLEKLHQLVEDDVKDLIYEEFLEKLNYSTEDLSLEEPREKQVEVNETKEVEVNETKEVEVNETKEVEVNETKEVEPEPIKLTIQEIFDLFVRECITNCDRNMLNFTDFSEVFSPWFQDNFPDRKVPKIQTIKSFFYNNPYSISNGKNIMMWKDFKIKNEYEIHQAKQLREQKTNLKI